MKSALDKMTSNQGQSFIKQSVLKSDENPSSVSDVKLPTCINSLLSNRTAALNSHMTPSNQLQPSLCNNISKPSNFPTAGSTSTVTFQSAASKQVHQI